MPWGDLPGWKQTFHDDFNRDVPEGSFPGSVYGPKWSAYDDGWSDTSGKGVYMPSKVVSVADGVLTKRLRSENGRAMVAALLPKVAAPQTYGRYTVRFRADSVAGYKTAWLLWPDSEKWPKDGEIDFPEGELDGKIFGFMHYANADGGQDWFLSSKTYNDWHTATIEWLPGKVSFILDDEVVGVSTRQVPSRPMHWVLQTETGETGAPPTASATGDVQIDWVSLYTRD